MALHLCWPCAHDFREGAGAMDLNRRVPWAPGKGVAADAAQSPDQPPTPQDAKAVSAKMPSFAPLPQQARARRYWSAAQFLILACAFAGGIAVGIGGTYLVHADLPLAAYLQPILHTQAPMENSAGARSVDVRTSPLPAESPSDSPRSTVGGESRDTSQALSSTEKSEFSTEVSALKEQMQRQFAEGRLDKPENDNALETYKKMAAIAPNDPATIALGGHLSAAFWSLANRARKDVRLDEALRYYGILKTLPPVPLAAILAKQSPEPSVTEGGSSAGAEASVGTLPEAAAALPTPFSSSEAAEPTKPPKAASAAPIVTSAPAASAPSPDQATAPIVAQASGRVPSAEPTNPRDVAYAAPIMSSPPNAAAPLTETAPTGSIAVPTPAVGAGSAAASSGPPRHQAPDQSASSETATSRDIANAEAVATPTPAVGANETASPGAVREQRPGEGTPNGAAASQVVANAEPIISSPRITAPSPEGPSAIIGIAMARGDEALAAGDVISARQFYELAASNGLAHAATAVGQTYDPNFLQGKGVRGALADARTAERWYEKAIDGGDAEARMRLDKLLKADQGKLAR
jgi:hypothetical protein